jgi:hypothetical protein
MTSSCTDVNEMAVGVPKTDAGSIGNATGKSISTRIVSPGAGVGEHAPTQLTRSCESQSNPSSTWLRIAIVAAAQACA